MSLLKEQESNKSQGPPVQRLYTENCLFLDLQSLSKSFQTILTQFTMIVIARVKTVTKQVCTKECNPYGLPVG